MLEIPNIRVGLNGNLWVGTHITLNDQLPDGICFFLTLFCNRESRCITDFQLKCEVRKCFGCLCGLAQKMLVSDL